MMPLVEFMEKFAERRQLRGQKFDGENYSLEYRGDGQPRVYCDQPVVVARFISEIRQEVRRRWDDASILLRGQKQDHGGMKPALFRPCGQASGKTLLAAEKHLEEAIRRKMAPRKRFQRSNLAALLQHYGVRTTWLDVVDDLRVAVWFATHDISHGAAIRRVEGTGWIYLLCTRSTAGRLHVVDLRVVHHGLSLRPHMQQGWSIRAQDHDLSRYVAATIEFPVSSRWHLDGYLGTAAFLFPPAGLDHTLGLLKQRAVSGLLRRTEREYQLPAGTLGRISIIQ
jgi:hypothetical protein